MVNGRRLGCCNMALWDFFAVAVLAGYSTYAQFEIHPFFCLLIGAGAGMLTLLLMRLRFLGALLQIACGVFWSQIIWHIGIHFHPTEDPVWIWGLQTVLALICIALHFASVDEILGPRKEYSYQEMDTDWQEERYRSIELGGDSDELQERFEALTEDYLEACQDREEVMQQAQELVEGPAADTLYRLMRENDKIWTEGTAKMNVYMDMLENADTYQEQKSAMKKAERLLAQMQQITHGVLRESSRILAAGNGGKTEDKNVYHASNATQIDENLFAGCRDKESLNKRYKSLMKTFHPDNADGDTEMTVKVRSTYEYLLEKYE